MAQLQSEGTIVATAPGKVILHGEYSVVFGKKAIAVSIELRTTVRLIIDASSSSVDICFKNLDSSHSWSLQTLKSTPFAGTGNSHPPDLQLETLQNLLSCRLDGPVSQAATAFLFLYLGLAQNAAVWPAIRVQVESEFPFGAGLGSSAAFSVALTAALMKAISGQEPEKQTVSEWAFKCEHIFHGKPSGIDNSICTFGGAILFQNGIIVQRLTDMRPFPALLVHTNVTRNTKLLVENVTRRRQRFPAVVNNIMAAMDDISGESWNLMRTGDYAGTEKKEVVTLNQHLLNALGAGHVRIDQVVATAEREGHVAKLVGAGGGGCVIVHLREDVTDGDLKRLKDEFTANNFQHWDLSFGGSGVTVKSQ